MTLGIRFAVRNVALASAVAITLLNRIEYAVFGVVYFLTEVPPLVGVVAAYRCCRIPRGAARGPILGPPVTQ